MLMLMLMSMVVVAIVIIIMIVLVAMLMSLPVFLRRLLVVCMLAIHDMRGYEMMQYTGYNLDTQDTTNEAGNKNPSGLFRGVAAIL